MDIPAFLSTVDIRAVIGSRVALKRKGRAMVGRCPFHAEKHPSFAVFTVNFKCFGCGKGGDVIQFIRDFEKVDFRGAVEILRGSSIGEMRSAPLKPEILVDPVPIFRQYRNAANPENVRACAKSLGVSALSLEYLDIGLSSHAWVFPMRDELMRIIGLRFRSNDGKKWTLENTQTGLFIPMIPPHKTVYVAEGPTDTAALLTLGFYAIGRPNANSKESMLEKFLTRIRAERVVIVTDNDGPKKKFDGTEFRPGLEGAESFQKRLSIPSEIWLPPAKDIRAALIAGLKREDVPQ